ncbi:MAG: aminoacyl-histidine dipeptidase [Capnocytophaga gingivalis]
MSTSIRELEPKEVWNRFADINGVPRPSKKEQKITAFMVDFGKKLGLETTSDAIGNVIIRKPATAGLENKKTIILQSHLDMVCQKNNDTVFDFDNQGIETYIDGDWVRAKGTTLGADNGLGVAAMMAILESKTIAHPAIEALFTTDEETGMTGAKKLSPDALKGEILLNLDTELDTEIEIGCAGGVDVSAYHDYSEEATPADVVAYQLSITGLLGGHSGMEINIGRGNANKIMNRLLLGQYEKHGLRLAHLHGGGLRNAIPRESEAVVVVPKKNQAAFEKEFKENAAHIFKELQPVEAHLSITFKETATPSKVMEAKSQQAFVRAIAAAPCGVYAMSRSVEGLVEASNNIANVKVENGKIAILCMTRSSVESSKHDLATSLASAFELAGYKVEFSGQYPGWEPNTDSPILHVLTEVYERLFHEKPNVAAIHAGLECGLLGEHFPHIDMISFGPTILGAHSPNERVSIKSVQKFWKYLLEILKNTPNK